MVGPHPVAAEINAIPCGLYSALAIQPKLEMTYKKIVHRVPAILKILLVITDNDHIVHVANIPFGVKLVFCELVGFVEVKIGKHLACQVADRHADADLSFASIDINAEKSATLFVINDAPQELQQITVFKYPA